MLSVLDNIRNLDEAEVLCVNDGSTLPYVEEIVKRYEKADNRIKYIFKTNSGVSDARNLGIDLSHGQYLTFVDADDYLETGALEYMLDVAERVDADLMVFGYCNEGTMPKNKTIKKLFDKTDLIDVLQMLVENNNSWLDYNLCLPTIWARLYRREILWRYNHRFPSEVKISQDVYFNLIVLNSVNNLYVDNRIVYYYGDNDESLIRRFSDEYFSDILNVFPLIEDFVCRNYPNDLRFIDALKYRVLSYIRFLKVHYFTHPQNQKSFLELKSELNRFLSLSLIQKYTSIIKLHDARNTQELKNIILLKLHMYWIFLITERRKRKKNN